MKLVIGGVGQGKLAWTLEHFGLNEADVARTLEEKPVVCGLQNVIKNLLAQGGDPSEVLAFADEHPKTIFICDEVGSGVVPVKPEERAWREAVGRVCCELAKKSDTVVRVFCGLPLMLKEGRELELILIRHGQTPGNLKRQYIGCTDQPLAPEGEELARSRQAEMLPIDKLWVSPMKRCRQTAAFLWPDLEQEVVEDLRECDFGIFECKDYEQLKGIPAYRAWIANEPGCGCPGGERRADFADRCVRGMEEVLRRSFAAGYERCGVVAHGGTIMEALARFMPDNTEIYNWLPKNCGGFRVKVTEDPLSFEVLEVIK